MRQMSVDSPVRACPKTVPMHDPQSLYDQAKERIEELHATADRRRGSQSRGRLLRATPGAILSGWRLVANILKVSTSWGRESEQR